MVSDVWNPWHGCRKYSEGCMNCYVYRRDTSIGKDASIIEKNQSFDLPLRRDKSGKYKIPSGSTIYTCMTSDFFIEEADEWREDIWRIIRQRSDVNFFIITKRILRFRECIPIDWCDGYDNVSICCTMENQKRCDERFPYFNTLPIKHKYVTSEPLLTNIDMRKYLNDEIMQVTVGGESGHNARICNYDWILDIRNQCIEANVPFYFKQTGKRFLKDNKLYTVKRKFQHQQAKKADINTTNYDK